MVLTILGLFGMVAAGLAADALVSGGADSEDDDAPPDHQDELNNDGSANLIDLDPDRTDGTPKSDDLPEPAIPGTWIEGSGDVDILSGLDGNDSILGGGGGDLIDGRDGNDLIDAGAGNDAVWGGAGNDGFVGGDGNDSLDGQSGDDSIAGGAGNDSLTGGEGDDSLSGDGGNDSLILGSGNDWATGGAGDDWLSGGDGDDSLDGGQGSDIVDGGNGDDWLSGLDGVVDDFQTDFLNGGTGNDHLAIGSGDFATGGEGEDTFVIEAPVDESGLANIGDYDALQDQLVVLFDPAQTPDPQLTILQGDSGQQSTILLDGKALAVVQGSPLSVDDIRLVPAT